nr:reverse transcriptase domain-containing protein [Tanacetum cinerariifolium]
TYSQIQETEMAGLREADRMRQSQIVETLRVMRDMRQEMGDMHAELLALRGQPRRAGQSGGDVRVPNHQDAPRDADSPEAYAMTWEVLKKKMTDKYCLQGELKKLEIKLWNLKVKGNDVPTYTNRFQQLTLICTKFASNENKKIDKYISGLPDNIYGNLKNKNGGNRNAQGWVYAVRNAEKNENAPMNPDSNVVTGTFLLNNCYASILFDTGANRSFISTAFSSLVNIDPTPLRSSYDVDLADGKIVGIDTIIRGCIINFLNHPFNIDLMPVELGSFNLIIGMDWLRRCHVVIVCDEKLVQIPYENETLTFCGNESNNGRESRSTVISCSKAQKYMAKGCQIFMAQDLPSLPPARPVEFHIDLISGVAPVA